MEEISGVGEAVLPFKVLDLEQLFFGSGGASCSHEASPTGPLHPVLPLPRFLDSRSCVHM